ncbi:MAG: acyl carrier protein [Pseudomonadota bacterium]
MNYTRAQTADAWQVHRIRCVCTAVEAGANEDEFGHQLSNLLKQYTRQLRSVGRIRPEADLLTDLGIDALGLFMILDRIGEAFGIDPIALTQQRSELRRFGDLVDRVSRLCRERRGNE